MKVILELECKKKGNVQKIMKYSLNYNWELEVIRYITVLMQGKKLYVAISTAIITMLDIKLSFKL